MVPLRLGLLGRPRSPEELLNVEAPEIEDEEEEEECSEGETDEDLQKPPVALATDAVVQTRATEDDCTEGEGEISDLQPPSCPRRFDPVLQEDVRNEEREDEDVEQECRHAIEEHRGHRERTRQRRLINPSSAP